jgi:hypothetical protein
MKDEGGRMKEKSDDLQARLTELGGFPVMKIMVLDSAPLWFFQDADAVQALRIEAASWERTPFAQFSKAKGVDGGIDCAGFAEAVMAAAGIGGFEIPRMANDYSRHVHNDRILDYLRGRHEDPQSALIAARFAELAVVDNDPVEDLMPGDVLILKDGSNRTMLGVWHMPVMMTRRKFMHCAPRLGVCEGNIDDATYRRNFIAHFRARAIPLLSPITGH